MDRRIHRPFDKKTDEKRGDHRVDPLKSLEDLTTGTIFAVLKQLWAILLLAGLLGQTFSRNILVLDYQCNKNYIAANLCENKDKPGMKCEGKCYLCKKIKTEDKKDQENPERRAENKFESVSSLEIFRMNHPGSLFLPVNYPQLSQSITHSCILPFLHPPQA